MFIQLIELLSFYPAAEQLKVSPYRVKVGPGICRIKDCWLPALTPSKCRI
jgi:hypothetical protein